jgi:3-oxoacyl-[acyl-carrier-protein] synthase II
MKRAPPIPVITGLGVVSPVGIGSASFWDALLHGRSGVRPVRGFDTSPFAAHIGCEIDDDRLPPLDLQPAPRAGRAARLAELAAQEAVAHAALQADHLPETGLCIGTTMGEACWLEGWSPEQVRAGPAAVPAEELLRSGPDQVGLDVAALLGLGGSVMVLAAACAAGNYAIGRAADLIRLGRAERVLAGATDAFSRVAFTGFSRMGALAAEACRPFSADRDGIVLAEGAAMVLVESLTAARERGAAILAEVAGFGLSCDAHHIVSPRPDGLGALRAMRAALDDAGLSPEDIDYICAHGTGTRANDRSEVAAVRMLFGDLGLAVPMSSIKSLTGHSLGAASALEAVACVLALQHQMLPATWNFRALDPECAWDIVPNVPRPARVDVVLNNAYAFGGNNASVLLRHPRQMERA